MTARPARVAGVYLVTDFALCAERGVVDTVRAAVDGGVRVIQLRDKTAGDEEFYDLVVQTADAVGDHALILVNDRVEVFLTARSAGAAVHGVHLGQGDMGPVEARRKIGPDAILGLSASTAAQLADAHRLPERTVDYFGVGVIWPTATKPDHPRPLGVTGFRALADLTPLPCVAIGGITAADLPAIRAAGGSGAAVVSAICGTPEPRLSAGRLVAAWER